VNGDTAVGVVFGALADDTRRAVLHAVAERRGITATELAEIVPVSRQAIAKHLVVLHEAGLVEPQRVGRETRYQVVPGSLRPAGDWIERTEAGWAGRFGRLQRHLATRGGAQAERST
jgi:DNA-binding transcriptional ArsR family regulator